MAEQLSDDIIFCCQKIRDHLSAANEQIKAMHNVEGRDYYFRDLKVNMRISISKIREYLAILCAPKTPATSIINRVFKYFASFYTPQKLSVHIINEIVVLSDKIIAVSNYTSRMSVVTREVVQFLMTVLFDTDITIGYYFIVNRKKINWIVESADNSEDIRGHLLALVDSLQEFVEIASTDIKMVTIPM